MFPDRLLGKYPLEEILLLCLLAVVAGAETVTDIAMFGRLILPSLRRFRPFADGTKAHDRLGDILATLDAEAFGRCLAAWVAAQWEVSVGELAIVLRQARNGQDRTPVRFEDFKEEKNLEAPIHVASAFAVRQRLVLGQVEG